MTAGVSKYSIVSIDRLVDHLLEANPDLDRQSLMVAADCAYENAAALVELVSRDSRFSMDIRRAARAIAVVIRGMKK